MRYYQIRNLAAEITSEYPPNYFKGQDKNIDPETWAKQSYMLAKTRAYQIQFNANPDNKYVKMAQTISKQRIALAGYRLANLLNLIFKKR